MLWALARLGELPEAAPPRLHDGERERLAGFSSAARRRSFIAGRWLARQLVACLLGGESEALVLPIDAQGRSRAHAGLALSISHSGDWVACAVARGPVGIDIEGLRPRGDLLTLAATVHSPAQCATLAELDGDAQLRRFYELWTLKEAWLKCRGSGLDFARMRALHFLEAAPGETAQAFSLVDEARGLVLAIDGGDARPDGEGWRGWRYA